MGLPFESQNIKDMTETRPYVICHMGSTVDGRIITENWSNAAARDTFLSVYEQCHNYFDSQAWLVGRVTMEKDFSEGEQPAPSAPPRPIARVPYLANKAATSFAIAIDAQGRLGWPSNDINGDHAVAVLTEQVPDDYLHYLQQKGVSYIFAGKDQLDLGLALDQLGGLFPIKILMLEGGGHVNGSFLQAGLIDELSLLLLPIADGTRGTPTSFEVGDHLGPYHAAGLRLLHLEQLPENVVWLRYRVEK